MTLTVISSNNDASMNTRLPRLCRLFEFEDDAEREFQARSMDAAAEIHDWYHQSEVWQGELRAEWYAEADRNGYDPKWSWKSDRGFARWVGDEVEKAGLTIRRNQIRNLFFAETMRRAVEAEVVTMVTTSISLPETERAWRPAMRLWSKGFKTEVTEAVIRASEIAEIRGETEVSDGIMSKAVAEVWRTAPRVRAWVEQPGQTRDPRDRRDRVVDAKQAIHRTVQELRRYVTEDTREWAEFEKWWSKGIPR